MLIRLEMSAKQDGKAYLQNSPFIYVGIELVANNYIYLLFLTKIIFKLLSKILLKK